MHLQGQERSADDMIKYYEQLVADFPMVSIEDPLAEDDWAGWSKITADLGDKVQLVGDDLYVTNPSRLQKGIDHKAGNAILVKVNQIGSLTETMDAVALAQRHGMKAARSRPVPLLEASGSPSTTSCFVSKRNWQMPPTTQVSLRSLATRSKTLIRCNDARPLDLRPVRRDRPSR